MSQPPKRTTRDELRQAYGVTPRTFRRWLRQVGILHRRHILTPADVQRCHLHLGEPGSAGN
jgi:phage antirepressor YoqD-like protein